MNHFTALLAEAPPLNDLGRGQPVTSMRKKLEAIDIDSAFAPQKIVDRTMADACLAGLWLRFDFLDQSHTISQSIHTPTGSYWHGIMHRREPDYENAKYWFRRVGKHPIFEILCAEAREHASQAVGGTDKRSLSVSDREAAFLVSQTHWDPFRFIDLVAAVADGNSDSAALCRQIQLREWQLLFELCCHAAIDAR